eukprot:g25895.t1
MSAPLAASMNKGSRPPPRPPMPAQVASAPKALQVPDAFGSSMVKNDIPISRQDLSAANGLIHTIREVMMPPNFQLPAPTMSLVELVKSESYLSSLAQAIEQTGLESALSESPLTVLMPTNEAFTNLGNGILESLLLPPNLDKLRQVVLHHVLDGNQDTTKLAAGNTMMTKAGGVESALHDLGNSHPRRMWPHRSNTDHADQSAQGRFFVYGHQYRCARDKCVPVIHKVKLRQVLRYHLLSGAFQSFEFTANVPVQTLEQSLVKIGSVRPLVVDNARALSTDVPATNGIIHMLSGVLLPVGFRFPDKNVMQLADSTDSLSTFNSLVQLAGLTETLANTGPYTIFAPTNAAFALLGEDTLQELRQSDKRELLQILKYHVINGKIDSTRLRYGRDIATLEGSFITVKPWTELGWQGIAYESLQPPVTMNMDVEVSTENALATTLWLQRMNGIAHFVNKVLVPPGVELGTPAETWLKERLEVDSNSRCCFGCRWRYLVYDTQADATCLDGLPGRSILDMARIDVTGVVKGDKRWTHPLQNGEPEKLPKGIEAVTARKIYRHRQQQIVDAFDRLFTDVVDKALFELAKEVFIKARPDAAKLEPWGCHDQSGSQGTPHAGEPKHSAHGPNGQSSASWAPASPGPTDAGAAAAFASNDASHGKSHDGSTARHAWLWSNASHAHGPCIAGCDAGWRHDGTGFRARKREEEVKAKEEAKKEELPKKEIERKAPVEPPPTEFEEIVNSLPVTPFWKIPAQKTEIPLGIRLRVFDSGGAREVASMAVTKSLIFGMEAERSHVVERHGQGVYAEHVALIYTAKERAKWAVTHHPKLIVKLRTEAEKLPDEKRSQVLSLLEEMEKHEIRSVLFQPGDGRKKLTWQSCVFSLGRSERIYFLDLISKADQLPEDDPSNLGGLLHKIGRTW